MKLKNYELKVFYNLDGDVNQDLDRAIEKALKQFGFVRWASGIAIQTGIRDIAFEKSAIKTP